MTTLLKPKELVSAISSQLKALCEAYYAVCLFEAYRADFCQGTIQISYGYHQIVLCFTHIPQFTERKNRFDSRQNLVKGVFYGEGAEVPKPANALGSLHERGGDQSLQSIEKSSAR